MIHTKRELFKILVLFLVLVFAVSGCKKRRAFKEEDGQSAVDVFNFGAANDAVLVDVNNAMAEQPLIRGKGTGIQLLDTCGVEADTGSVYTGIIVLNYTGEVCNNLKRQGIVKITVQNYPTKKWKQKGCVIKIDFQAYKVTNMVSNKIIQIDGTEYLSNESGGTWYEMKFLNQGAVTYALSGTDLSVHFDKDYLSIYSIGRKITYTWSKNVLNSLMEGTGVQGDRAGLDSWGQTRNGETFTSQVATALSWNSTCGSRKPLAGETSVSVDSKSFDLNTTFGVDEGGNPVTVTGKDCPYGWLMKWSYKRKTNSRVFAYQ